MKKSRFRALRFVVLTLSIVIVTPSTFGQRYGECKQCQGVVNDVDQTVYMACGQPDSGTWGSETCHIRCTGTDQYQTCTCYDNESQCYYFQVSG